MNEWQTIESAPKDGTWIQAEIPGHGSDSIIAWDLVGVDRSGDEVSSWVFMTEQEPPDSWDDGVCWFSNSDCEQSVKPTKWKPIEESKQRR